MNGAFWHFSVDDVLAPFVEVSQAQCRAADHPFFAFLDALHASYGTRTDLYLFAEHEVGGQRRRLTEASDRNRAEYAAYAWLRLGPHGFDANTPPHAQTPAAARVTLDAIYAEIARIAGATRRAHWLRLHQFSECFEIADYLRAMGVAALLLTDKEAQAHRLPEAARDAVRRHGRTLFAGLEFVRSHLRLEHLVRDGCTGKALEDRLDAVLRRHGFAVLFTHEVELRDPRVRAAARACAAFFYRCGVSSA